MVTSSEIFLARPKDSPGGNSGLIEHSLKTAFSARELAASLGLGDTAFYAGLLHDFGKLNPYYQLLFLKENPTGYIRAHAIFSALAANRVLKIPVLTEKTRKQILFAVAGHHSKLTQFYKSLEFINTDKSEHEQRLLEKSKKGTYENLQKFSEVVKDSEYFKDLAWNRLSMFQNVPRGETDFIAGADFVLDFLDFSSVFSVLIQADRGSFFDWKPPVFGINLNTDVLKRKGHGKPSRLSELREEFQKFLLSENSFQDKLTILKAPTGIGKTKIFLDIVNKLLGVHCFERVFYFSPLLALTDDFESKLFGVDQEGSVLCQTDATNVLVYNHAFTGSLLKKRQSKDSGILPDDESEDPEFFKTLEHFERESFNKQFIITTTQRLLMVLYSNTPDDKRKLVSFKNSLLIVDEVQTIPKVLLPNFIALLKAIAEKYNSRILLVSATIPAELQILPQLKTSEALEKKYLQTTVKRVEYKPTLDLVAEVAGLKTDDRTLFMLNTRRKALDFFNKLCDDNVLYLSSGIRKCDRGRIIQERIKNSGGKAVTVVSTQVLEAGVDVSFSRMYREMAPLDNIVQAMGRLSREGECSNPLLTVFSYDNDYKPYSQLEFEESKAIIPNITSSICLYEALSGYYQKVSDENLRNKNLVKDLEKRMRNLNFDDVWDFVKKNALPAQLGDPLLVPDIEDYGEIKRQFLSSEPNKSRGKLSRYAEYMAQLPSSLGKIDGLRDFLDEELLDVGVLLPKKESLCCVYDSKVGLDKWVKK